MPCLFHRQQLLYFFDDIKKPTGAVRILNLTLKLPASSERSMMSAQHPDLLLQHSAKQIMSIMKGGQDSTYLGTQQEYGRLDVVDHVVIQPHRRSELQFREA